MYRVFGFLKRDGLSMPEFRDYYENHHVPLLLSRAPKPPIHKRRYVNRDEEFMKTGFQVDFDCMVEVAFADEDAFLAYMGQGVRPDARAALCDLHGIMRQRRRLLPLLLLRGARLQPRCAGVTGQRTFASSQELVVTPDFSVRNALEYDVHLVRLQQDLARFHSPPWSRNSRSCPSKKPSRSLGLQFGDVHLVRDAIGVVRPSVLANATLMRFSKMPIC
jgi:hypothetical protein